MQPLPDSLVQSPFWGDRKDVDCGICRGLDLSLEHSSQHGTLVDLSWTSSVMVFARPKQKEENSLYCSKC